MERDRMNERAYDNRYFCAETYRDQNYDYSRPTYDWQYQDYNNDGYYDNQQPQQPYPDYQDGQYDDYGNQDDGQDCYDYDYENDICYDNRY